MTIGENSLHKTSIAILTSFSLRCIQVIAGVLGRAGEAGQKQRLAAAAEGNITYRPAKNLNMTGPEALGAAAKLSDFNVDDYPSGRMGNSVPEEREDETAATINTGLEDADEMATKLDEVNNHESHRTREGRDIKVSS